MKGCFQLVLCIRVCGYVLGYNSVGIEDMFKLQKTFVSNILYRNLSPGCNKSLTYISQIIQSKNIEDIVPILKFFDASTKIPTGLLEGNYFDFGNYDECLKINIHLDDELVYGKYCMGTISPTALTPKNLENDKLKILGQDQDLIGLHYAYCLPHTCTIHDFETIIPLTEFRDRYCYSKAETTNYDAADIVSIVILSIFLLLVILSTAFHVINYYYNREIKNNLLLAFSVWSNGKKIFEIASNSNEFGCINGIKAISMIWVIYGHVMSNDLSNAGINNMIAGQNFMMDKSKIYLTGATVSVDTFFAVGGLLVMYGFLKSMDKGIKLNIPLLYIHRYFRLTPALAVVVLFNATLIRYLGSGPIWGSIEETTISPCRDYWWSTLLYIQNYVNPTNMCLPQSWYLSIDMQLFILTPIILYTMQKSTNISLIALIILSISGIIVLFVISYEQDLPAIPAGVADRDSLQRFSKYYYIQTYARFGPYVIGMLTGYIIFIVRKNKEYLKKIQNNKMTILFIWTIAIAGMLSCSYGGADILTQKTNDNVSRSLYNALNRNAWALSVCIVVTLCCLDCGGIINGFLSLPIFQILAKLSYSMYLTHLTMVISIRQLSLKVVTHFEEINSISHFWGDFMITLMVSIGLCLVFESPMIIIEKTLLGNNKKPTSKGQKMVNSA